MLTPTSLCVRLSNVDLHHPCGWIVQLAHNYKVYSTLLIGECVIVKLLHALEGESFVIDEMSRYSTYGVVYRLRAFNDRSSGKGIIARRTEEAEPTR